MLKKSTLCRAWQTERCPPPRKPPPSWSPELGLPTRRGDCPGSPKWAKRNRQGLHKGGGKVKAKSWRVVEAAGSLSHRARRRSAWGSRSRRRSGVPPEPPGGSQPPARSFPDPLESSDLGSERANPGGFTRKCAAARHGGDGPRPSECPRLLLTRQDVGSRGDPCCCGVGHDAAPTPGSRRRSPPALGSRPLGEVSTVSGGAHVLQQTGMWRPAPCLDPSTGAEGPSDWPSAKL